MGERRVLGTFRHHLILTTGIATLVFGGLVAASIFLPLAGALDRAGIDTPAGAALADHFLTLHARFWPVVAGALIASVTSGILMYRRMAGPLVRYRQVYRRVAAGELPAPITIRQLDYLTAETDELNDMLEALREQATARKLRAERCRELLDALEERIEDPSGRDGLAALREVLKDLD